MKNQARAVDMRFVGVMLLMGGAFTAWAVAISAHLLPHLF